MLLLTLKQKGNQKSLSHFYQLTLNKKQQWRREIRKEEKRQKEEALKN